MFHVHNQYNGGNRYKEITIIQSSCGNDCRDGVNEKQRNRREGQVNSEWGGN